MRPLGAKETTRRNGTLAEPNGDSRTPGTLTVSRSRGDRPATARSHPLHPCRQASSGNGVSGAGGRPLL